MKKLKFLLAPILVSAVLLGGRIYAQDEGTYIDNASPQDSSYVEGDALNFDDYYEEENNSGNTAIYIGAAVIVVGGIVVFVLRKKKKK